MDRTPPVIQGLIERQMKCRKTKYSPQLRCFALTLQFYSSRAYDYVRRVWNNLLPHSSTLRKWCTVVNGNPGFTQEAFEILKVKTGKGAVLCNLVLDEMSIRTQVIYKNNKLVGYVDFGIGDTPTDADELAKNALVFMAVGLNGHWKIPIGYFLINSLNGTERSNLLMQCLTLLHSTGVICQSVTFDGASVNVSMVKQLGASFEYDVNFVPFFPHPVKKKNVYVFWDACHMLKLIRNTIGDKKKLYYNGEAILWNFFEDLVELQLNEGLHLACKISKKHINFTDTKMNVRLAAQLLSEGVHKAFVYLNTTNYDAFKNVMPTALFVLNINNAFDILNCRYLFYKSKSHHLALNQQNYDFLKKSCDYLCEYISNLKDATGTCLINSARKTGFLGFIICLKNIFNLYNDLKSQGLDYLLSFKLSQDHLETFFSSIRSRGGFNNNPNCHQFKCAYRKLLIKNEVQASQQGNCLVNSLGILYAGSGKTTDPLLETSSCVVEKSAPLDHDYIQTMWELSPYAEEIVIYIAGYVAKSVSKNISCEICTKFVINETDILSTLTALKNRGSYISPSEDTKALCKMIEKQFRQN